MCLEITDFYQLNHKSFQEWLVAELSVAGFAKNLQLYEGSVPSGCNPVGMSGVSFSHCSWPCVSVLVYVF